MEEGKEGQLLRDGNKPSFLQKVISYYHTLVD
jgi:hypothetical protein